MFCMSNMFINAAFAMCIVADVTKKWNNLRSQYLRELALLKKKSGSSGAQYVVKWRYFKRLEFLQPSMDNTDYKKSNLSVC